MVQLKPKVVMLNWNVKFEWTIISMTPMRLFCAFSLVLFWGWRVQSKKPRIVFFICIMLLYPWHYCQTTPNLDLYLFFFKMELKNVIVEFQARVGYWSSINHLQDYKIYGTMIKMLSRSFWTTCHNHLDTIMASRPNESKFQNMISSTMKLPIRIIGNEKK
jgi:hypothetical protein